MKTSERVYRRYLASLRVGFAASMSDAVTDFLLDLANAVAADVARTVQAHHKEVHVVKPGAEIEVKIIGRATDLFHVIEIDLKTDHQLNTVAFVDYSLVSRGAPPTRTEHSEELPFDAHPQTFLRNIAKFVEGQYQGREDSPSNVVMMPA